MDYQQLARQWLDLYGVPGEVIAQRQYTDRFVVVLDSGPKIDIPLAALDAIDISAPAPEPPPAKPKRKRRRRRKANG